MRAYRDIDFGGVIRVDHVPTLEDDAASVAGYSHQGRLHAMGYMAGLREAVLVESASANQAATAGPRLLALVSNGLAPSSSGESRFVIG